MNRAQILIKSRMDKCDIFNQYGDENEPTVDTTVWVNLRHNGEQKQPNTIE